MRLARLYQKLHCEPLMLSEDAFTAFAQALQQHMAAGPLATPAVRPVDPSGTDATLQDTLDYYRRSRATMEQIRVEEVLRKYGPVAVVQIHGAIDRNLSRMEVECYGACDLQDINAALDECFDPAIQTAILDFDTPGGNCVGHAETAARIVALRKAGKNVIAWVGGQCHSLGVYLAVHCDYIIIGASAWMGSIGVRCSRLDLTKALAAQGISVTNFASSDEKTDFASSKPLTPEEAARIQARVDMLYADFCAVVRAGRPAMSEEFFKAQIFFGQEAIDAGLADEMATSLDEVASELLATAAVYASNPGSGSSLFNLNAPRAEGGGQFDALADASFQAGNGGGNPNHDENGRFASVGDLHTLDASLNDKQRAVIAHVQTVIDKVHHLPHKHGFLSATVRNDSTLTDARAAYMKGPLSGDIHLKRSSNEGDFLEEVGHHLDHQMGGRDFASKTHPDLKEINQAIEKSAPVKELNRMARSAKGQTNPTSVHLRRAGRTEDKFARAYVQYVTAKSGDPTLQRQLVNHRADARFGKQKYWSDEQFAPIMKAFDNHLGKHKWK